MKKEVFNLSERRHDLRNLARIGKKSIKYYLEDDVKELINEIKKMLLQELPFISTGDEEDCEDDYDNLVFEINKLVGVKLK